MKLLDTDASMCLQYFTVAACLGGTTSYMVGFFSCIASNLEIYFRKVGSREIIHEAAKNKSSQTQICQYLGVLSAILESYKSLGLEPFLK